MTPEELYHALAEAITTMPAGFSRPRTADEMKWIGRVEALVEATGDVGNIVALQRSTQWLGFEGKEFHCNLVAQCLYKALASVELKLPATARGTFIPVGEAFTGLSAVARVLVEAKGDILIVDPYMDNSALETFAVMAEEDICMRFLSDEASYKQSLKPAADAWEKQYGKRRPLEIRLAQPRALHDRLIVLDGNAVYILTQSLKDLATRSPGTIQKVDPEAANLKIQAYDDIWTNSKPL